MTCTLKPRSGDGRSEPHAPFVQRDDEIPNESFGDHPCPVDYWTAVLAQELVAAGLLLTLRRGGEQTVEVDRPCGAAGMSHPAPPDVDRSRSTATRLTNSDRVPLAPKGSSRSSGALVHQAGDDDQPDGEDCDGEVETDRAVPGERPVLEEHRE